jgi:hypothetical protein
MLHLMLLWEDQLGFKLSCVLELLTAPLPASPPHRCLCLQRGQAGTPKAIRRSIYKGLAAPSTVSIL